MGNLLLRDDWIRCRNCCSENRECTVFRTQSKRIQRIRNQRRGLLEQSRELQKAASCVGGMFQNRRYRYIHTFEKCRLEYKYKDTQTRTSVANSINRLEGPKRLYRELYHPDQPVVSSRISLEKIQRDNRSIYLGER